MATATHLLTFEDLLTTPDDGNRYDIIDGELIVSPTPSRIHQTLLGRLFLAVGGHVDLNKLGEVYFAPVDVRLFPHDIVQPDLIFIRADRRHIYRDNPVEGPPDLVVGVLSPTSRVRDTVRKARVYAAAKVPEYWMPDPVDRRFGMKVLRDGRYEDMPRRVECCARPCCPISSSIWTPSSPIWTDGTTATANTGLVTPRLTELLAP